MKPRYLTVILFSLLAHSAWAKPYMCPNSYKYIYVGDAEAKVRSACGEPTSVKAENVGKEESYSIDQWIYRINLNDKAVDRAPTIMFTFREDKLTGIYLEGQRVNTTSQCDPSKIVNVGFTKEQVQFICGNPLFTNTGEETAVTSISKEVTWIYNYGPYKPTITLKFEKGVLKSIQEGAFGQ